MKCCPSSNIKCRRDAGARHLTAFKISQVRYPSRTSSSKPQIIDRYYCYLVGLLNQVKKVLEHKQEAYSFHKDGLDTWGSLKKTGEKYKGDR